MLMRKPMIEKPSKHYRLYCPSSVHDESGKGYNTFEPKFIKGEGNTIEHLIKIGEFMNWYQIVDLRNSFKVIKESAPLD